MTPLSPPIELATTLLSAPIELAGDWGHMIPRSADQVVERMRHSCLDGVRLSDRQPDAVTERGPVSQPDPDQFAQPGCDSRRDWRPDPRSGRGCHPRRVI